MVDDVNAVQLQQGPLRLALRADCGGAIAGLWRDGLPVLRSCEPHQLQSVRDSGCFALLPYSNRIARRQFRWLGRAYTLASNTHDEPHNLHGTAWLQPWQVTQRSADRVTLDYTHPSDEFWPFAFHAEQMFELRPDALRITLQVSNIDARETPMGLGWHPYFVRRVRSRVHLELQHRWDADDTKLPIKQVAQHALDADVAVLDLDNCFDGWRGPARIRDERLSLRMTSSLTCAVVYTPRQRDFFCVEPVSHVNNALGSGEPKARGMLALASGESAQAWMQLDIAAA
ncbi:MAG TPA: aldose 1-epimerase [Burkholderiaceae bacterium]|nr:aldose 1-epimerase [Burkholderiaceae bacterium]